MVLGVAVFLGAMAIHFQWFPSTFTSNVNLGSTPQQPSPSITQPAYVIPSWTTYRVSQYRFAFDYPSAWKAEVTEQTQPDAASGEHHEIRVNLTTDLRDADGRARTSGFLIIVYPNLQKLSLDQFIRKLFDDRDTLIVLDEPSVKIGNATNVLSVKDDSAYRRKMNAIFPISFGEYFIAMPTTVWRYSRFYQNSSFDLKQIEPEILARMEFPQE